MSDFVDLFRSLDIDTKGYASGSHYVQCPACSQDRKKKNNKVLLLNFTTGWYQCFHCDFKGFAQNADKNKKKDKPDYTPPPKQPQQFLPEPEWNWVFPDTIIDPKPENPMDPTDPSFVTWYFRDASGRLTSAKRMKYHFNEDGTMKRDKESMPLYITTRDGGYYPSLFYEKYLSTHPVATVILVESEKTAAFLTHKFKASLDEFIYLATGGSNGLTEDKCSALRSRNVWVIYDCDVAGREGAAEAVKKLTKLCNPRIIDIDPADQSGTDLGDTYSKISIDYIRELGRTVPEEIIALWQQTQIKDKPQEIPALISIQGFPTIRLKNISQILGKKKSRKTLFIVWILSEAIKQGVSTEEIILFDTEQDDYDVWLVRDRIFRITGKYIAVFTLVSKSTADRMGIITKTIQHWHKTPKICVIDGIRDLMRDINSIEETSTVIDWLQWIKGTFMTHVMCVLHMNKTSKDARGHIGTELLNKCEITIELEKDEKTGLTMVRVESARKRHFEAFAFTHSSDDLPELVDSPVAGATMPTDERRKRLASIFEDGTLGHADFKRLVQAEFAVGGNRALVLIREFLRNGWVIKNGKDGAKGTTYGLIMGDPIPQPKEPSAQMEIPVPEEDELPF